MNSTVGGSWSALNVSSNNYAFEKLAVKCRYFASCVDTLNISVTPQEHVSILSMFSELSGNMCRHCKPSYFSCYTLSPCVDTSILDSLL